MIVWCWSKGVLDGGSIPPRSTRKLFE